jgi:decaprenylphospho-beta-D-erythro-pentofuranosid-2-ulose 2-reductase
MSSTSLPTDQPLDPQKRAIIVGASSGLGEALAQELASQNYYLALLARREDRLKDICSQINKGTERERARYYVHDVTNYDEIPGLFQRITRELGGVDLFIYSAGHQESMTFDEYNFQKDKAMVEVNLLGAMAWLNQASLRFERAKTGKICGISSIAGDRGRRLNPGYNTSKAGLTTYLEALRNRVARYGVTVTTVKPGFMDTDLLAHASKTMWVISPESAAKQIIKAIRKKKQIVYVPGRWRTVMLVIKYMPSFLFRRLSI